eukprot:1177555-Pleurochrysis_carterae.AAC.1
MVVCAILLACVTCFACVRARRERVRLLCDEANHRSTKQGSTCRLCSLLSACCPLLRNLIRSVHLLFFAQSCDPASSFSPARSNALFKNAH